jgi:hypothetical protein
MNIGMRLGGEQIIGPSTYCLLLPPSGSALPIQLLFGEVHRSVEKDEKTTYDQFLSVLDKIGKTYPVHFYTDDRFIGLKDIHWDHLGARCLENSIEGYIFQYIREFLYKQSLQPQPIKKWLTHFEQDLMFTRNTDVVSSGISFSMFIILFILNQVENCPRISERLDDPLEVIDREVNDHYHKFLYELMGRFHRSSTIRHLNKLKRRGYDLKETLKRMPGDDLEKLKPALHELFSVDMGVLKNIQKLLLYVPISREDEYYEQIQIEDMIEFQHGCEKLLFFLDNFFCYLLDNFYIVRMLQEKNSYLTVGYFGDAHTQHIKNYLINHLGYRVSSLDIDLDQLLEERHIKKLNKGQ